MATHHARKLAITSIPRNFYSVQAAAQQQSSYSLPYQHPQVSRTPDGITVSSFENNSPLSHVSILAKAGPRYESAENAGMSHLLRACVGLRSKKFTSFLFKRQLEHWGANLTCAGDKEFIRYSLTVPRANLDGAMNFLFDTTLQPEFREYEVREQFNGIALDVQLASRECVTMELLHKAAYRNTSLANTLLFPKHKLEKMHSNYVWENEHYVSSYKYDDSDQLVDFYKKTHTAPRLAFVGVGVEHDILMRFVNTVNVDVSEGEPASPATYLGGEIRQETGDQLVHVAAACPGVSIGSEEIAPLTVAQHILGNHLGTANGSNAGYKLTTALASAGGTGFVSAFNKNYTDSGLFGVYIITDAATANESVKAVVKAVRALKISEPDLAIGKKRAKSNIFSSTLSGGDESCKMGLSALFSCEPFNPVELSAAIDKVTTSSAQNALANVLKGKISMAALGGTGKVPYIDEL